MSSSIICVFQASRNWLIGIGILHFRITSFTVNGDQITVSEATTTRMMCNDPQGVMEQEAGFLAALQSAKTFSIEADRLTLFDAGGTKAVEFAGE